MRMNNEMMPMFDIGADLLVMDDKNIQNLYNQSKKMVDEIVAFKELMMMYSCAIKEIRTKFEILSTEFNLRYQRNPINFINTRLKSSASIVEKMKKNNITFSLDNIQNKINDIAGVRVTCSYIDDIYVLTEALAKQDDVEIIKQKDYIKNPKSNGYRSMHLIVKVPVFFANQTNQVRVEVQIRTIAMDFWATLEHQLKYKKQTKNSTEISAQLKECADVIRETDRKMFEIRKQIEANTAEPTEEDILIEKIRKFDLPIGG